MSKNKSQLDPLPEHFKTIEELAEFWDTHDSEDYPEAWREVQFAIHLKQRQYPRILLEPRLAQALDRRARRLGVSPSELVNELLREGLARSPR